MKKTPKAKIGEDFGPAPQFKKLYFIYFLPIFLFAIFSWYAPILIFAPPIVSFTVSLFAIPFALFVFIFTVYWIPKYYGSIIYRLTGNEMEWRRGVWFKKTGIVPYNRITNVDIAQGPVSRALRIAALKIQTAGYSAPSSMSSEIKIEGMENFEELRELIMGFVRGGKPVAVETYDKEESPANTEQKVLSELVKIRKLLEKSPSK